LLKESGLDIPFIIVSGSSLEDPALERLPREANEIIRKDRLSMVRPVVQRVLRQSRKRAERKQLEARLRQAQKMETIGRVASAVAHDFNNILMAIMVETDLSAQQEDLPSRLQDRLKNIKSSAQRAASLTGQLLRFAKGRETQCARIDLNEEVTGLADMLQRVIGESVRLQFNISSFPLRVDADPALIGQVLLFLVISACDAVSGNGQILVETLSRVVAENEVGAIPPGTYACLRIRDTGSCVTAENLSRIFDPLFSARTDESTKELGLATVSEIVQQLNGFIKLCSTVGHATTFEVHLPLSDAGSSSPAGKKLPEEIRGGAETILVVEDDPAVRSVVRLVLERYGYQVLDASDGRMGLERWAQHELRVDLLLTDLVLPGAMSGLELAAQLRHCESSLKVLFMSGYNQELVLQGAELHPGQSFLQKPCSMVELLRAVRTSLDQLDPRPNERENALVGEPEE
jgi:signal transduction histidine kinase/CheY-like chemotaxis protein